MIAYLIPLALLAVLAYLTLKVTVERYQLQKAIRASVSADQAWWAQYNARQHTAPLESAQGVAR